MSSVSGAALPVLAHEAVGGAACIGQNQQAPDGQHGTSQPNQITIKKKSYVSDFESNKIMFLYHEGPGMGKAITFG